MSSTCDRCSDQLLCHSVNQWPSNYETATSNMHIRRGKKGAMTHTSLTWRVIVACVMSQSTLTTMKLLNVTSVYTCGATGHASRVHFWPAFPAPTQPLVVNSTSRLRAPLQFTVLTTQSHLPLPLDPHRAGGSLSSHD